MQPLSVSELTTQTALLIRQRTGLTLTAQARADLPALLDKLSNGRATQFLSTLRMRPEYDDSWRQVIHALTVGETYFMRERAHFHLLTEVALPGIIAQRQKQQRHDLFLWSAGCATGEEPYSIAMSLQEMSFKLTAWNIHIIGTDLDSVAVETAQKGLYRNWSFRHTSPGFQTRYFDRHPNGWSIKPEIRDQVTFRQNNLLTSPPYPQLDVIFCRNVLIYFDLTTVEKIENMLFDALVPGGWLFLSQAEAMRFQRDRWTTHVFPGAVIYQKPASENPATAVRHTVLPKPTTDALKVPDQGDPSHFQQAVFAVQHSDHAAAERILIDILSQSPSHIGAHTLLASVFANRGAKIEAHTHLNTALTIDPLYADAHTLRAMLYIEEERIQEAREALRFALYCQQTHALALMIQGNLLASDGETARAENAWQNARKVVIQQDPEAYVSALTDLTVGRFRALLDERLKS